MAKVAYQNSSLKGTTDIKVSILVKEIAQDTSDASMFKHLYETRIKDVRSGNHMQPDLVYRAKVHGDWKTVQIWKGNSVPVLMFTIEF